MEEIHVFNVRILDAWLDTTKWKGLKRITLDNCSLTTMNTFDGFLNLETLILMSNKIKDIPALQSLPKLKLLDLQNNYLTSLKGLQNCKLPSLNSLEVGLNLIEEIGEEVDIFPVLEEIDCSNQRTDTGNVKNSTVGFEKIENLEHGYQEILFHRL
jgi:Leucine-rich repeat (LRR) protein